MQNIIRTLTKVAKQLSPSDPRSLTLNILCKKLEALPSLNTAKFKPKSIEDYTPASTSLWRKLLITSFKKKIEDSIKPLLTNKDYNEIRIEGVPLHYFLNNVLLALDRDDKAHIDFVTEGKKSREPFPEELSLEIFGYLNVMGIGRCSSLSTTWQRLVLDPLLLRKPHILHNLPINPYHRIMALEIPFKASTTLTTETHGEPSPAEPPEETAMPDELVSLSAYQCELIEAAAPTIMADIYSFPRPNGLYNYSTPLSVPLAILTSEHPKPPSWNKLSDFNKWVLFLTIKAMISVFSSDDRAPYLCENFIRTLVYLYGLEMNKRDVSFDELHCLATEIADHFPRECYGDGAYWRRVFDDWAFYNYPADFGQHFNFKLNEFSTVWRYLEKRKDIGYCVKSDYQRDESDDPANKMPVRVAEIRYLRHLFIELLYLIMSMEIKIDDLEDEKKDLIISLFILAAWNRMHDKDGTHFDQFRNILSTMLSFGLKWQHFTSKSQDSMFQVFTMRHLMPILSRRDPTQELIEIAVRFEFLHDLGADPNILLQPSSFFLHSYFADLIKRCGPVRTLSIWNKFVDNAFIYFDKEWAFNLLYEAVSREGYYKEEIDDKILGIFQQFGLTWQNLSAEQIRNIFFIEIPDELIHKGLFPLFSRGVIQVSDLESFTNDRLNTRYFPALYYLGFRGSVVSSEDFSYFERILNKWLRQFNYFDDCDRARAGALATNLYLLDVKWQHLSEETKSQFVSSKYFISLVRNKFSEGLRSLIQLNVRWNTLQPSLDGEYRNQFIQAIRCQYKNIRSNKQLREKTQRLLSEFGFNNDELSCIFNNKPLPAYLNEEPPPDYEEEPPDFEEQPPDYEEEPPPNYEAPPTEPHRPS